MLGVIQVSPEAIAAPLQQPADSGQSQRRDVSSSRIDCPRLHHPIIADRRMALNQDAKTSDGLTTPPQGVLPEPARPARTGAHARLDRKPPANPLARRTGGFFASSR